MMTRSKQITIDEHTITVGLGELSVVKDPSMSLACFGLGSCINLCAYDPISKVAGMAHIVLPESNHSSQGKATAKYADIAVPLLLEEMVRLGALKSRMVVNLIGGAQMIQAAGFEGTLDMGARNLERTRKVLASGGMGVSGADTGGTQGRSVWLSVDSGKVMVRTAGKALKEL